MSELIIIAGPQAAGKSTIITQLAEQYHTLRSLFPSRRPPLLFPLQESRQIVVHKYALLGAIFMTREHEREVVECDFSRMDIILGRMRDCVIYLDECNIFTIAHATAHGIGEIARHFDEYLDRLAKFRAKIIFIDVPPDISWERRRMKYAQRLVYFPRRRHAAIMRCYREYLSDVHPLLLSLYRRIQLPKEMISGSLPESAVAEAVSQALARLSTSFR